MVWLLRLLLIVPLVQVQSIDLHYELGIEGLVPILSFIRDKLLRHSEIGGPITKRAEGDPTDKTLARMNNLLTDLSHLSTTLLNIESRSGQKLDTMMVTTIDRIASHQPHNDSLRALRDVVIHVNGVWKTYLDDLERPNTNNDSLNQFMLTALHVGVDSVNDWPRLLKVNEVKTCLDTSQKQEIYNLYSIFIITEIRAYIMGIYAAIKQKNPEPDIEEITLLIKAHMERAKTLYSSMREATRQASSMIRACDPIGGFKKEKSCAEMEGAFQSIIVNEALMSPSFQCKGGCEERSGLQEDPTINHKCNGVIDGCRHAEELTICQAQNGSSRHYEWFQEGTSSDKNCSSTVETVKDWWNTWLHVCEYCICTCHSGPGWKKPRATISLLPAKSAISKNMVVTGIKINYENNIITLQVEEGKLAPLGKILNGTARWVPVKEIVFPPHEEKPAGKNGKALRENKDYLFLSWTQRRIILDEVLVPKGHVVAGVRFYPRKNRDKKSNSNIVLQVLSVPFNYETGKVLLKKHTEWISVNKKTKRMPITFDNADVPLKHKFNTPNLKANRYVDFQGSGLVDFGQTTIPFWDLQEVVTSPSSPLQGVRLFHKGDEHGEYGGYLALGVYPISELLRDTRVSLQDLRS